MAVYANWKGNTCMKLIPQSLPGVYLIEPDVFGDHRGYFMESWSEEKLKAAGLDLRFVQDNESFTAKKGTLRGLHCQIDPGSQLKIVRVITGAVLDVAVDLRKGSPTYLQWVGAELSAENKKQLLIPRGFAHGFLTLTDDVTFAYKVDQGYAPLLDRSIRFDDPELGVNWGIDNPILSAKDAAAPLYRDSDISFTYLP